MKFTEYDYLPCKVILDILQPVLGIILYLLLGSVLSIIHHQKIGIQFPSTLDRGCPTRTLSGGTRVINKNILEMENISGFINH